MKRFLIATALAFALWGSALAGDIPSVPGPPPPDDVTITIPTVNPVSNPSDLPTLSDEGQLPGTELSFLSMLLGLIL